MAGWSTSVRMSLFACLTAAILDPTAAKPASYQFAPDEALVDQATHIVEVEVLEAVPALPGTLPATDYIALVNEVVKGVLEDDTIAVRLPGGVATDGRGIHVPGVPRFREGDRALLFLIENDDRSFGVLHLALGAFRLTDRAGDIFAVRDLRDVDLLGLGSSVSGKWNRVRHYSTFRRWLQDRSRGVERQADYFREEAQEGPHRKFTLQDYFNRSFRWPDFDSLGIVDWRVNTAGSEGSHSVFAAALAAWTRVSGSRVRLREVGLTGATNQGFDEDGVNALFFGDPHNHLPGRFSCKSGGLLSIGIMHFDTRDRMRYKSKNYYKIHEGDLIVNDGAECFLKNNPSGAAEMFTHQIGHTLGFGHSCGDRESPSCGNKLFDEATMRTTLHLDGRGATLRTDDENGARFLYTGNAPPLPTTPAPAGPDPAPDAELLQPTNLVTTKVTKSKVELAWEDNSNGETGYEIAIKIGRKPWTSHSMLAGDETAAKVKDLDPGTKYKFKVRAVAGDRTSPYSDRVEATTLGSGEVPAAPTELEADAASSTEVELTWRDNADNEKKYVLFVRKADQVWTKVRSMDPDTTATVYSGATPGVTYSFRVRAKRNQLLSEFSNVATLTMPESSE